MTCTCWLGTGATFGSSEEREKCTVHGERVPDPRATAVAEQVENIIAPWQISEDACLGDEAEWRSAHDKMLAQAIAVVSAALADAKREAQPQWQPIETATNVGRILAFYPHYGVCIAQACMDGTWWADGPGEAEQPTFWMPMPAMPSQAEDHPRG